MHSDNKTLHQEQGPGIPPSSQIVFWFLFLTLLGIWPALTNGQPFFYADTTAYVRGADLAISKALGSRFATDWAKDQRRIIKPQSPEAVAELPTSFGTERKASQRVVLAGRSIVYGALLYFGEVTHGLWLAIVVQSLIATYLIFLLTVRVLLLKFSDFVICSTVLSLASQLPFFASFLMPDVFAGFLILAWALLAAGWDRLNRFERAVIIGIVLFAVLVHTTHLIVLFALTILTAGYALFVERAKWINIRRLTAIAAACVLIALLWEVAFSFAVTRAFGSPPVRPPFIMAKLVSMLGPSAVSKVCASHDFVVCRFQDRFPLDDQLFLWSEDESTGVFSVADVQTKRALSDEQTRFALAIIPPNLGHVAAGVCFDGLRQLTHIGLSEYFYNSSALAFYGDRLPSPHFERMRATLAARSEAYVVFGRTILCAVAIVAAIITLLLLAGLLTPGTVQCANDRESQEIWRVATYILLAGILLNAFVCGGASGVNARYESRVIWLIQLSLITGIAVMKPHWKVALPWRQRSRTLLTCRPEKSF
jgi:hypothetical protein